MLLQLHIENIALLNDIQLEFSTGFNVLTGETGAGKSIIVDSLKLALGEKNERSLLSNDKKKGIVEALFLLQDDKSLIELLERNSIDFEDKTILLSREINSSGRSVCRINGSVVSANTQRDIAQYLVDIYGQHDYSSLLRPTNHLSFLDAYSKQNSTLNNAKDSVLKLSNEINSLKAEYKDSYLDPIERERRLDLLRYQFDEINDAELSVGEDERLEEERDRLIAAETIRNELNATVYELQGRDNSTENTVEQALKHMLRIERYSDEYKSIVDQLNSVSYELEDAIRSTNSALYDITYDSARIKEIEDRIDQILNLKRKYGRDIAQILQYRDEVEEEIIKLEENEEKISLINKRLTELLDLYYDEAKKLSEIRHGEAESLKKLFEDGISELGMNDCSFKVQFEEFPSRGTIEGKVGPTGLDKVEFLVSTNKGSELRSLGKVLSGGELSRAMLVLKTICSTGDMIDTLIFDEIDSGIGGITSWIIGKKLKRISNNHQVICVTHLAPVAAFSESHFYVYKTEENQKTETRVTCLSDEDKRIEIARMLGGTGETDILYADTVIEQAKMG